MFLDPKSGGVGMPNLSVRLHVNRLYFYIRMCDYKELLSWRKCFDHFFEMVRHKSVAQLDTVNCPKFYKEIRKAIIKSRFRRRGNFIYVFEKQF